MSASGPRVPVAVLGVGHLGSRHAQRLAENAGFRLVSVHDRDPGRAASLASQLDCRAARTLEEVFEGAEAIVIATATPSHAELALNALDAGKHVLVEKPLTATLLDAERVVLRAASAGRVLHVGQVERWNPAIRSLLGELPVPLFIESHRLAPLVPRNLDLDVVQDLMVHDLDLALAFVGAEPVSIDAAGVPVITERIDIANARLRFPGGIVANLTASRVSLERTRKFRMFLPGTYVSADCAAKRASVYRLKETRAEALQEALRSGSPLEMLRVLDHRIVGDESDALTAEHDAFRDAVLGKPNKGVSGDAALGTQRALDAVASAIAAAEAPR